MFYLQITMCIAQENRAKAAKVYEKYKQPFLDSVVGAKSKEFLLRDEDVQVLHGFDKAENAKAYLESSLFKNDVVSELSPLFDKTPQICLYEVLS